MYIIQPKIGRNPGIRINKSWKRADVSSLYMLSLLDLVIFNKFFKSSLGLQPNSCKTQKQSIWYKKFGSELLTKVPAFAISVRRFYYMNIEGK